MVILFSLAEEYRGCFIGVELPKKYWQEYLKLSFEINKIIPDAIISSFPHLTIYYLGIQTDKQIQQAKQVVLTHQKLLSDKWALINGYGLFENQSPALFLNLLYPHNLALFRQAIEKDLHSSSSSNLAFHPHVSLLETKNPQHLQRINDAQQEIKDILNRVCWVLNLSNIDIFGKTKDGLSGPIT